MGEAFASHAARRLPLPFHVVTFLFAVAAVAATDADETWPPTAEPAGHPGNWQALFNVLPALGLPVPTAIVEDDVFGVAENEPIRKLVPRS